MIPLDRVMAAKLLIGRTDGQTWEDLAPFLKRAEVSLGDVAAIGTESSGVDSVVRTLDFTLRGDTANRFSPRDRNSAWNQFGGEYAPLLAPNREVVLQTEIETPLAISRRETLQADFAAGTLTNVQATAAGNLELSPKAAPIFVRPTIAYKKDGSQVASGVARYEAGQFEQGLMIEEGTTNLAPNPRTLGPTGWVKSAALVRTGGQPDYRGGTDAVRLQYSGALYEFVGFEFMPSGVLPYAGGVWLKSNTGVNQVVNLAVYRLSPWNTAYIMAATITPQWQRFTLAGTLLDATAHRFYIIDNGVQAGAKDFSACWATLEQKTFATSTHDGTRAAEMPTIPSAGVLSPTEGTIEAGFYVPDVAWWKAADYRMFIHCAKGNGAIDAVALYYRKSDDKFIMKTSNEAGAASYATLSAAGLTAGLHRIVGAYSPERSSVWLDDTKGTNILNPSLAAALWPTTSIGYSNSVNGASAIFYTDTVLDDLRISNVARSDAEILAAYQSGQPLPVDKYTTYKLNLDGNLSHGEGGYRLSPVIDLSPAGKVAGGSNIVWTATTPAGTGASLETNVSLDGGINWQGWQTPTNGGAIAGITEGLDLTNVRLQLREGLTDNLTGGSVPQLNDTWLVVRGVKRVWTTLFHGLLGDSIKPQGASVTCSCRDLAKRLQDHYIEGVWDAAKGLYVPRTYGSEAGVLSETVIQQVLDDELGTGRANVGSSGITLYCPVASGYALLPFGPQFKSVWDALQEIATQRGWFLGYRPHPDTGEFVLTYMEPPRTKDATTADFVLDYEDDFYVEDLDVQDTDIRNVVTVLFNDKDDASKRKAVTVADALDVNGDVVPGSSIAEYGRRAMQIAESATSQIDTVAEATDLANAALADLHDLTAAVRIEMPFLPNMDVFAGVVVHDPRISSTDDFYGIESVRHTLEWPDGDGEECRFRTEAVGAGRVVGAHTTWLEMQTRPGAAPPIPPGAIQTGAVGTDTIATGAVTIGVAMTITSDDPVSTTSQTPNYVDIPGYELTFEVDDDQALVLLIVSADAGASLGIDYTPDTAGALFVLNIDGVDFPSTRRDVYLYRGATDSALSLWVPMSITHLEQLARGTHTIKVRFAALAGYNLCSAQIRWRELTAIVLKR
jgi:hypothetical protein